MSAYDIVFGRYTDSFKSDEQVHHWKLATEEYQKQNFLNAYDHFFRYLLDTNKQNVKWSKQGDRYVFEIQQGSKYIKGEADAQKIVAEAKIASFDKLNMAWSRRLLEMNYAALRHSRYAIKDNTIVLRFDSSSLDGSPEKLYHAFKEVAKKSDKQDDLLLAEFEELHPIDSFRIDYSEKEKETRYTFLQSWIEETTAKASELSYGDSNVIASYMLLNLAFKIDYLITPQGKIMSILEQLQQHFVFNPYENPQQRNKQMIHYFKQIQSLDKEAVKAEIYKTNATFGLTQPTNHESLVLMLKEENEIMEQMVNSPKSLATNHLEYIAQYAMFNFSLRKPTRLLLNLLIELINTDYVKALGGRPIYVDKGKLEQNSLQKILKNVQEEAQKKHPAFKIDAKSLNYDSVYDFGYTLLGAVKELDYQSN